ALEHTEAWPGGRTNHYLFDMNRDWFALTQPETRGRVKALQQWYPLVFVDLHEMGSNSTYYFAPEAVPYNPHLTKDQRDSLDWFGKNNARWFDQFGFSYFTKEVYDAFYPGYGASWPSYYGGVAMTYEQASARGLLMERRRDGNVFHFRETVRQHFVASVSTCETAAERSRDLLRNFYSYRQSAIEEGAKEKVKAYVLPRRGDVSAVDKLAGILATQGVEVQRTGTSLTVDGKQAPAGSYVISLTQPAKRLIRTLLDPDVEMEKQFLTEQERLRKKNGWFVPVSQLLDYIR
ncbi:MAG: peptidase M14, partial [bacterium]|nr:peptidase M14 [bacterium]